MIITPKMWGIKQRTIYLAWVIKCYPRESRQERSELKKLVKAYEKLSKIDSIGLKVIQGGKDVAA